MTSVLHVKHRKLIAIVLLDLSIVIAIIFFAMMYSHSRIKIDGIFIDHPLNIPEFHLHDQHGNVFTKDNLKGHWTLMFFGFTHCEMVCPATLSMLNKTYKILQNNFSSALLPQIIFVTVDPKRDTIDKMNDYINAFNPHFIGISGEANDISAFEKQISITASTENNTINHSTEILLITPAAKIQAYFPYLSRPESIANDFKLIVKKYYD